LFRITIITEMYKAPDGYTRRITIELRFMLLGCDG